MNIGGSCNGMCVTANSVSLVAISAAINSKRGKVSCFSGATRVFANTNETWSLSVMKTIAPYAFWLASAKQWIVGCADELESSIS